MKLYLSSQGIPNTEAWQALFANKTSRIAIIPTAWPQSDDPSVKQLQQLGFETFTVDLAMRPNLDILRKADGVWVLGGNSFVLNYWMRESGFDSILPDLLQRGFVYGGESAGAVVAGKTLHGIELLDNPADAPDIIWEGLNLVPYGIIPHWQHHKYAGRIEQTYDEMQLFCPIKTLTNEQYIVIDK